MNRFASRLVPPVLAAFAVALLVPVSSSAAANSTRRQQRRAALMANRPVPVQLVSANVAGTRRLNSVNPADVQAIQQAYQLLAQADHDYKGHRAKAMQHLHQAGKVLGINLKGDGTGKEAQANSDTQLKQAQTVLKQMSSANNSAGSKRHQRAMKHVGSALGELNTALAIK